MREDTVTTKVYPFDELSDDAKQNALEKLYDLNVTHDWWESTYEDAERIGLKITSFDFDRRECEGDWIEDAEDTARLILAEHGETCETYKDAGEFVKGMGAERIAYKSCENTLEGFEDTDEYERLCEEFKRTICEDYWIMLQKEYEYQTSEESIVETIQANEYEFTADGMLH